MTTAPASAPDGRIRALADIPDVFSFKREAVSYIVDDLIPRATVTLLTAPPGVGKSWLSMRLAICCAHGSEFLGCNCQRTPVLYLDRENPLSLILQRLEVAAEGSIPNLHYWGAWVAEEALMLGDPRLLEISRTEKPLIVFDSLVRFHGGDENDASQMRVSMAHLRALGNAGATVLIIHHAGKAEGNKYRGSSDILAGVDTAYSLQPVDGLLQLHRFKSRFAEERIFTLRADLSRGTFELTDSPAAKQRRDDVAGIAKLIAAQPGISQNQIIKVLEIGRTSGCRLLKNNEGARWRTELGPNHSLRYFPLSCTEYSVVPGTDGTTPVGCTTVPAPLGAVQSTTGGASETSEGLNGDDEGKNGTRNFNPLVECVNSDEKVVPAKDQVHAEGKYGKDKTNPLQRSLKACMGISPNSENPETSNSEEVWL